MNRALGILGGLWLGFALCPVASAVEPQGSLAVQDQASVQGYATNWGPHGSVSGELKLGPGSGLFTLRYAHVPESGIAELSGNIGGLAILLGYELWL